MVTYTKRLNLGKLNAYITCLIGNCKYYTCDSKHLTTYKRLLVAARIMVKAGLMDRPTEELIRVSKIVESCAKEYKEAMKDCAYPLSYDIAEFFCKVSRYIINRSIEFGILKETLCDIIFQNTFQCQDVNYKVLGTRHAFQRSLGP